MEWSRITNFPTIRFLSVFTKISRLVAPQFVSLWHHHLELFTQFIHVAYNSLFGGSFLPDWFCPMILIAVLHTLVEIVLVHEMEAHWLTSGS